MTPTEQRAKIRELLAHRHCNDEIRTSLANARSWLDLHRKLSAVWEVRLMRYEDALALASRREANGETPFVDLPRERKRVGNRRPRSLEERAAHVVAFVAPDWTRDPSLLPKRPPGRT